jgi:tetratricopeptide (TPR) repeat protein
VSISLNHIKKIGFLICMLCLNTAVGEAWSQEIALFSSIKGEVHILKSQDEIIKATLQTRLSAGDSVITGKDGKAAIMYYSGREIILDSEGEYGVQEEIFKESIIRNLASLLSDLLWGEDTTETMAGTTRSAKTRDTFLKPTYPRGTKILESRPTFYWIDENQNSDKNYLIIILCEEIGFYYELRINNNTDVRYPSEAQELRSGVAYAWTIQDVATKEMTDTVKFSLLSAQEKTELISSISELMELCEGDVTNPKWYLLTSALYFKYGLMKQAENSILSFIKLKPDMARAYNILAEIYKRIGLDDEANSMLIRANRINQ